MTVSFCWQVVNYSESRTAEEICESASKMITFIDLAGHHKYLKTTIFGLTSYCPDFAMLVVSANTGIGKTLYMQVKLFCVCIFRASEVCLKDSSLDYRHSDLQINRC